MKNQQKLTSLFLSMALLLTGCAHQTETQESSTAQTDISQSNNDPYESFNRRVFAFNQLFDTGVLKPAAKGYRTVTTPTIRTGVSNFYNNLKETRNIVNGTLQANGNKTLSAAKRLLANTFWGFFGFYDVASDMQIPRHDNDFGQTLAIWGWENSDTYIVLPFFGSSNPRDIGGVIGDFATPPSVLIALTTPWTSYPLSIGNYVQQREQSIEFIENLHRSSTDFYATVRTMTQQNRQKVINEALGKTKSSGSNYEFEMDFGEIEE